MNCTLPDPLWCRCSLPVLLFACLLDKYLLVPRSNELLQSAIPSATHVVEVKGREKAIDPHYLPEDEEEPSGREKHAEEEEERELIRREASFLAE